MRRGVWLTLRRGVRQGLARRRLSPLAVTAGAYTVAAGCMVATALSREL